LVDEGCRCQSFLVRKIPGSDALKIAEEIFENFDFDVEFMRSLVRIIDDLHNGLHRESDASAFEICLD
jgi:hypothetical protein